MSAAITLGKYYMIALAYTVFFALAIALGVMAALRWSRRKRAEMKDVHRRDSASFVTQMLIKDVPKDFYVSIEFVIAFALVAVIFLILVESVA